MDSRRQILQNVNTKELDRKKLLQKYWDFIKPYRFVLMLILGLGLLQLAIPLIAPYMTGVILIDQVLAGEGSWTLQGVALVLVAVYIWCNNGILEKLCDS